MVPVWMDAKLKEESQEDEKLVQDFIESLNIVHDNPDLRHTFESKYNQWARSTDECISSLIERQESLQDSISPSLLLRVCTTCFLSFCFLESIRCKYTSFVAGLLFIGLLLLMSLVTAILFKLATTVDGPSRSVISFTAEINHALVELGFRLMRTHRRLRFTEGVSHLRTYRLSPWNISLLSRNVHVLKLWLSNFLSWCHTYGVVLSVLLSFLMYFLNCNSSSEVLSSVSCGLALFLALLQDVKIFLSKVKVDVLTLKSQTDDFLLWFRQECHLKDLLENSGVLNIEILKCFISEEITFKPDLRERSLNYIALVVHAIHVLQYDMHSINFTNTIRYLLFKRRSGENEMFVEEDRANSYQIGVTLDTETSDQARFDSVLNTVETNGVEQRCDNIEKLDEDVSSSSSPCLFEESSVPENVTDFIGQVREMIDDLESQLENLNAAIEESMMESEDNDRGVDDDSPDTGTQDC